MAPMTKLEDERARAEARRRRLDAEVERLAGALRALDDVDAALVFGSYARGDTSLHSDLDLMVVRRDERRYVDRIGDLYDVLRPRIEIDLLVYTPEEFAELRERRYFVKKAVREGKVLVDRRGLMSRRSMASTDVPSVDPGKDPKKEGERWQSQAEQDLAAARLLAGAAHFNLACFHSQQAAEKSLKAFLYGCGRQEVRGHGVQDLSAEAAEIDPELAAAGDRAAKLDKFYIPTRYPNGLAPGAIPYKSYDKEDADRAIGLASEVLALVGRKLQRPKV